MSWSLPCTTALGRCRWSPAQHTAHAAKPRESERLPDCRSVSWNCGRSGHGRRTREDNPPRHGANRSEPLCHHGVLYPRRARSVFHVDRAGGRTSNRLRRDPRAALLRSSPLAATEGAGPRTGHRPRPRTRLQDQPARMAGGQEQGVVTLSTAHGWTGHSRRERLVYYTATDAFSLVSITWSPCLEEIRSELIRTGAISRPNLPSS